MSPFLFLFGFGGFRIKNTLLVLDRFLPLLPTLFLLALRKFSGSLL